jgi:ABC-type Fe3+-hydroxamate transport system substrate-binding protein
MHLFYDQLKRRVQLPKWPPKRIVSLVPSQTELLHDLDLEEEVTGITKFCVHPASWFRSKTRVGGTKTVNSGKIATLNPDLILGNKEENDQTQIEALAERYPVWLSDIKTLDDALDMIRSVGALCDKTEKADKLARDIRMAFNDIRHLHDLPTGAIYLIWRKPYMAAGGDTFINSMMESAGFYNVLAHKGRYPTITPEILAELKPEWILLSSEPYPFGEKHIAQLKEICPGARVVLVDGTMFSWYGSRLLQAPDYFKRLKMQL